MNSKSAMRNTGGQCWISCDEGGIPRWIWCTTRAAASGSRLGRCNLPVLATLHLPRHFYPADAFENVPQNVFFNCVSAAQSRSFADLANMVGVVRNGIAVSRFPFVTEKEGYLLWMGRVCEEKGPHVAIEVATANRDAADIGRAGVSVQLSRAVLPSRDKAVFGIG